MAGISVDGGGHGAKKALDAEISLIPFIDLLLCCIMFLLVTAVWTQMARLEANQQQPGQQAPMDAPPPDEQVKLILQVQEGGYILASTAGESIPIPKLRDAYDVEELKTKLRERRRLEPSKTDIIVAPDDGIPYENVVNAMDVVIGEGYKDMSLSDGASML